MEPSSEALAARIQATRGELSDNLDDLAQRMKDVANWRIQYERHTVLFLGVAVIGGVLLSQLAGPRSRRKDLNRVVPREVRPARSTKLSSSATAANLWSDVKAAAGSALGSQVYSTIKELIPGIAARARERTTTRNDARYGSTNGHTGASQSATQESGKTAPAEGIL